MFGTSEWINRKEAIENKSANSDHPNSRRADTTGRDRGVCPEHPGGLRSDRKGFGPTPLSYLPRIRFCLFPFTIRNRLPAR